MYARSTFSSTVVSPDRRCGEGIAFAGTRLRSGPIHLRRSVRRRARESDTFAPRRSGYARPRRSSWSSTATVLSRGEAC